MSKDKNPRRVADNEAMAKPACCALSPQKAEPRCATDPWQESGQGPDGPYLLQKADRSGREKCLQSAIANAENNHNLDVDELIVAEAWVGKNMTLKRGRPRARGRFGKIMKPLQRVTILVRQVGGAS